jgi:uncharacterized membrane protein YbhN (UPF0104 family)
MKKITFLIMKLLISGSLLLYLFSFSGMVDVQAVLTVIQNTRISIFALVFLIGAGNVFISTKRWSFFLPQYTTYLRLVSLNFIGFFFSIFLPGRFGGDMVKTFYIYRDIGKGGMALASVFMDRYMGFSAITGISFFSFLTGYSYFKNTGIAWFIPLVSGIFILASYMLWRIKWGKIKSIRPFYISLMEYQGKKRILFKGLALSFIIQAISIIEVYLLSTAIGLTVPIIYFFIFVPIINAVSAIPVSIAGLGVREAGFAALFNMFFLQLGVTSDHAVSLSLLIFAVMILVNLIGGIEYVRIRKLHEKK